MTTAGLILLPLAAALAVWALRGRGGRTVLTAAACGHLALWANAVRRGTAELRFCGVALGYDRNDPALTVMGITSVLFLITALYLTRWLPADAAAGALRREGRGMPRAGFIALLLVFLATMTLTALARDFGMLWVAVEATTLASAPLINFHRSGSSLEAGWKYLLLCSLGIGLALFGTMLLSAGLPEGAPLDFSRISRVDPRWFKAAFVFCFAGYGLKAGLAPFHSWLPDAHSEAPAPVSALLSGSLLNCAMLGLWRIRGAAPAGLTDFCDRFFLIFGLVSLVIAALFIIHQRDFKRMLAYSSVEHMGLIALLTGAGCREAALVHMVFHALTKMTLFLAAGDLLLAWGTRRIAAVRGMFARLPRNGMIWMTGMLMICGTPPSPLFFTEWALIRAVGFRLGAVILLLLLVVFCGMAQIVSRMCMGTAPAAELPEIDRRAEKLAWVPLASLALVLLAGLWFCAVVVVRRI